MNVYSSSDSGAPTLPNTANALNALLYACLVTGYGSKAGAGWTRPYTGTNLAVFRQGTGGNGRYLRVFDGSLQADNVRRVNVRGYEAMTAVSTGTGPFPTTGQISGNGANFPYFSPSTAGSTSNWILFASSSFFMLLVDIISPTNYWEMMGFGSFFSFKSGDTFNDVLMASPGSVGGWQGYVTGPGPTAGTYGVWVARNDTGVAGAKESHLVSVTGTSLSGLGQGSPSFPYPDRVTNGLLQAQPTLWCDGYRRGRIPGLWETFHVPGDLGGNGTTWSGVTGPLAGKSFRLFTGLSPSYVGIANPTIETSDTWS